MRTFKLFRFNQVLFKDSSIWVVFKLLRYETKAERKFDMAKPNLKKSVALHDNF